MSRVSDVDFNLIRDKVFWGENFRTYLANFSKFSEKIFVPN
jgi:hypothetical protein|tara:strand:- start:394 stop:516 length:123 start_codon:yes stop_codon:yes gene_type:complete